MSFDPISFNTISKKIRTYDSDLDGKINLFSSPSTLKVEHFDPDELIKQHPLWELLTDFEDSTIWTVPVGTATFDTTEYLTGSQSLRLDLAGGDQVRVRTTFPKFLFDPRKIAVRVWIKIDKPENIDWAHRLIWYAPFPSGSIFKVDLPLPPAGEWTLVATKRVRTELNPDPIQINAFEIHFNAKAGTTGATVWIDRIEILPPLLPKGAVILTHDDNLSYHYEMFKIEAKYGLRCVSFACRGGFDINKAKIMQIAGCDICNHTYKHTNPNKVTDEEREEDVRKMKEFLIQNGFNGHIFFAYPFGITSKDYIDRKYAVLCRTVSPEWEALIPLEGQNIRGLYGISSDTPLSDVKTEIDKTIEYGRVLVILLHGIDGQGYEPWTSDNYDALCSYIAQKGVPVITFSDWWKIITTAMTKEQVKEMLYPKVIEKITSDYSMQWYEDILIVDATTNPITIRLPRPDWAKGKIYIIKITYADATNTVTIKRFATENIDGSASDLTYTSATVVKLTSDGTDWWTL